MLQITRQQFIEAIKTGIAAAPDLTEDETNRLATVALHAPRAGANFLSDPGCPAALAGIGKRLDFAFAYDDFICDLAVSRNDHSGAWLRGVNVR